MNLEQPPPRRVLPVIEHTKALYRLWLPIRRNMARDERFGIGKRIDTLLLDLLEHLRIAVYARVNEKSAVLGRALNALDSVRFFLQVAWESKIIANKQYEEFAVRVEEIGRMIGGWRRGVLAKTPPKGGEREE